MSDGQGQRGFSRPEVSFGQSSAVRLVKPHLMASKGWPGWLGSSGEGGRDGRDHVQGAARALGGHVHGEIGGCQVLRVVLMRAPFHKEAVGQAPEQAQHRHAVGRVNGALKPFGYHETLHHQNRMFIFLLPIRSQSSKVNLSSREPSLAPFDPAKAENASG